MGRKPKFSPEQKLAILKEVKKTSISQVLNEYSIDRKTLNSWRLLYKYQGIDGLNSKSNNRRYSLKFKISLVASFKESIDSALEFAIKNGLKSDKQLFDWIKRYNDFNIEAYPPRKRDSSMPKKRKPAKKTTFEKRLKIIEDLIKHNLNYNLVANKNNVSYIQVYNWYKKYTASGNNPESLRDNRGKSKPEESLTEIDRLKAENRLLKAQLEQQEMEIAFAKKLMEIRNRGGKEIKYQAIKELHNEHGWAISKLAKIAGVTRDAYYKWFKRSDSIYRKQQIQLLNAIIDLEEKHNYTLGYLSMITQLKFEGKLNFKVGLKRVRFCMRKITLE